MTIWRQPTAISLSHTRLSDMEIWPRGEREATSPGTIAWLAAFALVLTLVFPVGVHAGWPEHPVKLIVTFPPGSANDAAARIFADGLSRKWGKPVVVEDRPGAEGTIGVGAFVSSQDDHTLLYTVAGSVTVAPLLIDQLSYDVDRDLVPIAATTAIVLTLAVNSDLSIRSIPSLIDAVRSNPGKYAWASGPSLPRYVFAAFLKRNDLRNELRQLSRRFAAPSGPWRGPDPGPGDVADGLLLSGADRKGALPRGD